MLIVPVERAAEWMVNGILVWATTASDSSAS